MCVWAPLDKSRPCYKWLMDWFVCNLGFTLWFIRPHFFSWVEWCFKIGSKKNNPTRGATRLDEACGARVLMALMVFFHSSLFFSRPHALLFSHVCSLLLTSLREKKNAINTWARTLKWTSQCSIDLTILVPPSPPPLSQFLVLFARGYCSHPAFSLSSVCEQSSEWSAFVPFSIMFFSTECWWVQLIERACAWLAVFLRNEHLSCVNMRVDSIFRAKRRMALFPRHAVRGKKRTNNQLRTWAKRKKLSEGRKGCCIPPLSGWEDRHKNESTHSHARTHALAAKIQAITLLVITIWTAIFLMATKRAWGGDEGGWRGTGNIDAWKELKGREAWVVKVIGGCRVRPLTRSGFAN